MNKSTTRSWYRYQLLSMTRCAGMTIQLLIFVNSGIHARIVFILESLQFIKFQPAQLVTKSDSDLRT